MSILKKLFSQFQQKPGEGSQDTITSSSLNSFESETTLKKQQHLNQDEERTQTEATELMTKNKKAELFLQEDSKNKPTLWLLSGSKELIGVSWPLKNLVTSIGRSKRLNDVVINHKHLSKIHFQIIKEKDKFYIIDLKSTNKTYINDDELPSYQKTLLENNFYIRAGDLVFKFLSKGNIEFLSAKKLLSKSQTDPLTGAGNRYMLNTKGCEYFLSAKKLSLIVFDIDNFKNINDRLGHTGGDYVLKNLSQLVLEVIREGDLFIRYGGDEFCIFTPNSISIAGNIADRIKQKIQIKKFTFKKQIIEMSISVGLAEKKSQDKSWEDIYHRADQQSYERKRKKKHNKKSA